MAKVFSVGEMGFYKSKSLLVGFVHFSFLTYVKVRRSKAGEGGKERKRYWSLWVCQALS